MREEYSFEFFDCTYDTEVEIVADSPAELMDAIKLTLEEQSAEIRRLDGELRALHKFKDLK